MNKFLLTAPLLALMLQCSLGQQPNVYEVAFSMQETFSTLVALLNRAGLVNALKDPQLGSTVFAPTNDAFAALDTLNLPSANTQNLLQDPDWKFHLQDILLYHVLGGSLVLAESITDGLTANMLNGEDVTFSVLDGTVAVNSANVVAADVSANNGVIHVIDQVLAPSWIDNSIVDRALSSGIHGTLVNLVTLAGLVETLSGPGKFTVFAPTDEAFNTLLTMLNVGVEYFEENSDFLTEVLLHHVVPGIHAAEELVGGVSLTTLQGGRLSFAVTDSTTRVNGQEIIGSLFANNGIVHVVSGVIAPPTPFPATSDNTIVDVALSLPESFSTLVSLVAEAGLVPILSQPLQFTVFAPVNEAFDALDPNLVAKLLTRPWKSHLQNILSYHVLRGLCLQQISKMV